MLDGKSLTWMETMATPIPLSAFVTLGQRLYVLTNPLNVNVVVEEIPKFIESLDECGLPRTRAATNTLNSIASVPYSRRTGLVTGLASSQLRAYMEPVFQTMYAELDEQHVAAVNTGAVSQELRDLHTTLSLNDTQQALLNETTRCIESAAYRAGAVMGWNLAYDFIRQWVFDHHLAAFNAALTTNYLRRNGNAVYGAINDYSDFFSGKPDERTVIDTCHLAQIIGEKLRDNLRFFLRKRNDYAHPSFTSPSQEQTNAYVKDLIDTITSPPFTEASRKEAI